jgi:Uncharacterized conserved domain (SAYSvFN)
MGKIKLSKKKQKQADGVPSDGKSASLIPEFTIFELAAYAILQYLFYYIELGSVFFIIALFYFMLRNTKQRNKESKSAYSVFNANQDRIGGSLTSDQIEGEIMRKMY